ncbi:MAG: hypothetical protein VSS75_031470 [Candidatus Parabeggiatoa sp.]|nr:hypothetical protein [Candidatus Parabeggiatoa sp.]
MHVDDLANAVVFLMIHYIMRNHGRYIIVILNDS